MPTALGVRVRQRRTELGLTQHELAKRAGISKSFLSDVENGKRSIGAETLLDLGRSMGVSLDYLMTGAVSDDHQKQTRLPPALTNFAVDEGLSVRDAFTLLHMLEQTVKGRKDAGRQLSEGDWREFFVAVKKFL